MIKFQLGLREEIFSRKNDYDQGEFIILFEDVSMRKDEILELIDFESLNKGLVEKNRQRFSLFDVKRWQIESGPPLVLVEKPLNFSSAFLKDQKYLSHNEDPLSLPKMIPPWETKRAARPLLEFGREIMPETKQVRKERARSTAGVHKCLKWLWSDLTQWLDKVKQGEEGNAMIEQEAILTHWRVTEEGMEMPKSGGDSCSDHISGVRERMMRSIQPQKFAEDAVDPSNRRLSGLEIIAAWNIQGEPPRWWEKVEIEPFPIISEEEIFQSSTSTKKENHIELASPYIHTASATIFGFMGQEVHRWQELAQKRKDTTTCVKHLISAKAASEIRNRFLDTGEVFPDYKEEKLPQVLSSRIHAMPPAGALTSQIQEAMLWLFPRRIKKKLVMGRKVDTCKFFFDPTGQLALFKDSMEPTVSNRWEQFDYQTRSAHPQEDVGVNARWGIRSDEEETNMLLIQAAMQDAEKSSIPLKEQYRRRKEHCSAFLAREREFPAPLQQLLKYCRLVRQLPSFLETARASASSIQEDTQHTIKELFSKEDDQGEGVVCEAKAPKPSISSMTLISFDVDAALNEYLMLDGLPVEPTNKPAVQQTPPESTHAALLSTVDALLLPFEQDLTEEIMRELVTYPGVLVVMDALMPLGVIAIAIMAKYLPSMDPGGMRIIWVQPEEEIPYAKHLIARCGPSWPKQCEVGFFSWSDMHRLGEQDKFDLALACRFSYQEHANLLGRVTSSKLVIVGSWPAQTGSELYLTKEKLNVEKVVVRQNAASLLNQVRQRIRTFPHGLMSLPETAKILRDATQRIGELASILERERIVPSGWLGSLPGSWEYQVLLVGLFELDATHPLIPLLQELYTLVGMIDRLMRRGTVAAWEFAEEARISCGCAVACGTALSQLVSEMEAGILRDYPKRSIEEITAQHRSDAVLVIVEWDLERMVLADRSYGELDVVVQVLPVTLEHLRALAGLKKPVIVETRNLPDVEALYRENKLILWPFEHVIDLTLRWPGSAFILHHMLRHAREPRGMYRKVKSSLRAAPEVDQWISHFETGCPGGRITEIEYLDYEIVFSDPIQPTTSSHSTNHQSIVSQPAINYQSNNTLIQSNNNQSNNTIQSNNQYRATPVVKTSQQMLRGKRMAAPSTPVRSSKKWEPLNRVQPKEQQKIIQHWQNTLTPRLNGQASKSRIYAGLDDHSYIDPTNGSVKSTFFSSSSKKSIHP